MTGAPKEPVVVVLASDEVRSSSLDTLLDVSFALTSNLAILALRTSISLAANLACTQRS